MNTNSPTNKLDTVILVLLGLSSFGGGTGRFVYGLGFFDFFLIISFVLSLARLERKIKIIEIRVFGSLFLILAIGVFSAKLGRHDIGYEFFITELRFFIYLPILYVITLSYRISISFFEKLLPVFLLLYIFIWAFLLNPGTIVYSFFNDDIIASIGSQERITGPSVLILPPLLLLLIYQKPIKPLIICLYSALVLLIFIRTGGRTYFIFYLLPLLFLIYKRRRNTRYALLASVLIVFSILILREVTSSEFYERFLNITNVSEDSSFMYRVYNIDLMLDHLKGKVLLLGYGIGSNYEVSLYGWKKSFFLDNTFVTLVYKVGVIGLFCFLMLFWLENQVIPRAIYFFEVFSIFLIGFVSYHLILNPVFVYGYFIILNYFRTYNSHQTQML